MLPVLLLALCDLRTVFTPSQSPTPVIWVEALVPAVVDMEAEVEGVETWRCVSLLAELEGVVWTVEVAASGMRQVPDLGVGVWRMGQT